MHRSPNRLLLAPPAINARGFPAYEKINNYRRTDACGVLGLGTKPSGYVLDGPGFDWGRRSGFTDINFLLNSLLTMSLATLLGAVIAYHPKNIQTADTLEEIEAPKVFITYAMIGALIGIMVVKYGLVVGFVFFGIGGLIRFRTVLRSAMLTGQVIFVTLVGLACGLDLPHVAVMATSFGFVLIYILESHVTYSIDIRAIAADRVGESATSYRTLLEANGCKILSEKKDPGKKRLSFIFRTAQKISLDQLKELLETEIDPKLKGSVNWEID